MKYLLLSLCFYAFTASAQKLKKNDKQVLSALQQHVAYLADDQLEGRRTGSKGEQLAAEYISKQFQTAGILPKGDKGTYLQVFEVKEGKELTPASHFIINGHDLKYPEDYFPFIFCPDTSMEATAYIALHENGSPWFYDLKDRVVANKHNPHYDLTEAIKTRAEEVAKKGATALIVFNSDSSEDGLQFEGKSNSPKTTIPVLYLTKAGRSKYIPDETASLDVKFKIAIRDKIRYGHNVAGYIDNKAGSTIVLGAHYDHLGYGEDRNSLYTGVQPAIHNGADDNASGTGAMIELGKLLKAGKLTSNNYLLLAFSGEELGLFGSKHFTENPTVDLKNINYMINLDMVGRLKDSTRGLSIGGVGTSPLWDKVIPKKDKFFTLALDSSGTGPSDHTSFYRKDIPVLFFFTGTHSDYHKPSDDADKVNYTGTLQVVKFIYSLLEKTNKQPKLAFTKTREVQMSTSTSFKVSLGIMPDYTFSGPGVRADGVTEGRAAQKAGILAGDIIMQLGDHRFNDIQAYMQALNKFNKGDATTVTVKRGNGEMLTMNIVF